jgi:hypothetical protein
LPFGTVNLLIAPRDYPADTNPEPGRLVINIHADDAQATARHLDTIGVTRLTELEYGRPEEAWFRTVIDPDGNYVQIIEFTEACWAA